MSMGHSACTAWTISDEDCAKVCKKAWQNMVLALADKNMGLDEAAEQMVVDEPLPDYISSAIAGFMHEFSKKTGLSINLGYHNSDDEGDVNGHFWDLGGVTYMTAKAKRLGEKIKFSSWVTFG